MIELALLLFGGLVAGSLAFDWSDAEDSVSPDDETQLDTLSQDESDMLENESTPVESWVNPDTDQKMWKIDISEKPTGDMLYIDDFIPDISHLETDFLAFNDGQTIAPEEFSVGGHYEISISENEHGDAIITINETEIVTLLGIEPEVLLNSDNWIGNHRLDYLDGFTEPTPLGR